MGEQKRNPYHKVFLVSYVHPIGILGDAAPRSKRGKSLLLFTSSPVASISLLTSSLVAQATLAQPSRSDSNGSSMQKQGGKHREDHKTARELLRLKLWLQSGAAAAAAATA